MFYTRASACVHSAVVPSVIITLTGIPWASTAKCILVLISLSGSISWFPPMDPAACGWTLQWFVWVMIHSQSGSCPIIAHNSSQFPLSHRDKNVDGYFFNPHIQEADRTMGPQFLGSKNSINKLTVISRDAPPPKSQHDQANETLKGSIRDLKYHGADMKTS